MMNNFFEDAIVEQPIMDMLRQDLIWEVAERITLDEFVVMPNHVHGILIIKNSMAGNKNIVGNKNFCSQPETAWQTKLSGSISSVIRGFKIGVTKYFRHKNNMEFRWQK